MTHDTTGRYWRFDPCGLCDDPECCEGEGVDATAEVAQLREECLRLAPLWADYSEDVLITGVAMVRCHPEDADKVTDHISALRAERDEANERIALLVQKYEHEAKQLEAERDQYRTDAGMREAERDVMHAKLIAYEKTDRKLCAAIVRLQRELDALQMKYTDECFENERMRGVVEAAVEWIESWGCDSPDTKDEELALAIKAYRAASSEANGISKLDPNSASSKQPHNPHRNIATNNPERNETDPAITSSTQDSNTDTDRDTGHNDE